MVDLNSGLANCKETKKNTKGNDQKFNMDAISYNGVSEANIVECLTYESSDSSDSSGFAFIILSSHAYTVHSHVNTWYVHSAASEHMSDKRKWFSTFKEILKGTWPVSVAGDRTLRARGCGDIKIEHEVNGV